MPKTLNQALLDAQKEMPDFQKNAINPHYGNSYLDLKGLMEGLLPVLQSNDLLLLQTPSQVDGAPALTTRIIHVPTGESIEDTMLLSLTKSDPQAQGSAITYARRYSLMALLGLVADEDDDGEAASGGGSSSTSRGGSGRRGQVVSKKSSSETSPKF